MKVKVLSDKVINQIAAGEVVDRPAAVVRELVDNALDAGARDITVTLQSGGQTLIKVVDNGCGMDRSDALLAFERHATSKIQQASDLLNIASYGFRGEALASIAAISKARVITRSAQSLVATQVEIKGGVLQEVSEVAGPVGTEFTIQNLFFNTPARKKFLRQPSTEEKRVKQWLMHSALGNWQVRYRLIADGRELLLLPPQASASARAERMFKGNFVSVQFDAQNLAIEGLLAHPGMAQKDSAALVLLVNRRLVSDRLLLRAVKEGFGSTLKDREFPVGFINLTLPGEQVDVNVHPQKAEVRFRDDRSIFAFVRGAVAQAVGGFRQAVSNGALEAGFHQQQSPTLFVESSAAHLSQNELAKGNVQTRAGSNFASSVGSSYSQDLPGVNLDLQLRSSLSQTPPSATVCDNDRSRSPEGFSFSRLRYIGQALECFLFCELDGKVYVIDMHAAHERYNYNLVRNRIRNRARDSQLLLVPETIDLDLEAIHRLDLAQETLQSMGFELESFGEQSIIIRAVPGLLINHPVRQLILEFASSEFAEMMESRFEEALDYIAARIACHASIRKGYNLKREEAYALFESLDSAEFSAACPHGRPIVVSFDPAQVERWFGRDR